jgi:hypothetical protein
MLTPNDICAAADPSLEGEAAFLMPLTAKGKKIRSAMRKEYGKRGDRVFYASQNTIKGTHKKGK